MAEGSWFPVFHEDLAENFPDVWNDDKLLVAWVRLTALADKWWPATPELPARISRTVVKKLTGVGLITLGKGHTYTVRGLDRRRQEQIERQLARSEQGRDLANRRWHGNAPRNAKGIAPRNAVGNARLDANEMQYTDLERDMSRGAYTEGRPAPRTNGRSRQPTVEERLVELREKLKAEPDPDLAGGIEATIARLEGKPR